jgi:hypothetical protein
MAINELKTQTYKHGEIITLYQNETSGAVAYYFNANTNEFVGLITTEAGEREEYCRDKDLDNVVEELTDWLND